MMDFAEAYKVLAEFQKWRRSEGIYSPRNPEENKQFPYSPALIGKAIDVALDALKDKEGAKES